MTDDFEEALMRAMLEPIELRDSEFPGLPYVVRAPQAVIDAITIDPDKLGGSGVLFIPDKLPGTADD